MEKKHKKKIIKSIGINIIGILAMNFLFFIAFWKNLNPVVATYLIWFCIGMSFLFLYIESKIVIIYYELADRINNLEFIEKNKKW